VHVAPACTGSEEGSDHFGSYARNLYLHFYKRLFLGLKPMTTWSQDNNFTLSERIGRDLFKFQLALSICTQLILGKHDIVVPLAHRCKFAREGQKGLIQNWVQH
jgi:hypothetical protein